KLTVVSAREALKKKEFSAVDLTKRSLEVIKEKDGELHAFLEVFDDVLDQAEVADKKIGEGIDLPLLGIPVAIKDNILFKGHIASAGSKILENYRATYDSTLIKKLKEAGAIIIGRTNCDEFAMGSSTENSAYGITKNPVDTTRVPGGSSGGSAVVVAAGMVLASFGSDTGGSIRQPAAFTGIVGMKPTYGRVSRSGLIAMASSLDQIGPFTKTVGDAELLYEISKGRDDMDSTTISDDTYEIRGNKKVIGVPRSFFESSLDKEVMENFNLAVEKFKKLGYEVRDIELPHLKYSLAVYYILMPAEVSSNLARFDGVKYGLHVDGENSIDDYFKTRGQGFGREARRRVILGTYILSSGYYDAYYGQAQNMKKVITDEIREAFKSVDVILTPTTPTPAFKFGEKSDPLSMYLADIFTVPANITGCPSISVPSGSVDGLPLGVLITGDLGSEEKLFATAKDFEKS
ncbi:MAG TPA: Asp-tRNA(Asn)/Glu-tRNA(Gln) amidotransferase subunit GatA, partial [Parcubacteria group bacterium]|nr:Asp-tRNA(Asn)/Glu-tRNA(Gln) amidotransferase subunit GatA [Parcubacteria group bacterium]